MKLLFLIIVSISFLISIRANSQVQIELSSNGKSYRGIIVSKSKDSITIITAKDKIMSFANQNIVRIVTLYSRIKLTNGKTYSGHISSKTKDDLTIRTDEGEYVFQLKRIVSIEQDVINADSYSILGITFLTPGGWNILAGFQTVNYGFRAEIGTIPYGAGGMGAQANVMFKLFENKITEANFSVCAGYSNIGNMEFTYAGPCLDLNLDGLFLEAGIGFGSGTIKNRYLEKIDEPQLLFQIGYVYRFKK